MRRRRVVRLFGASGKANVGISNDKGTLILTAAGFAARLLGFFNRVYLANLISNAELGRYQLIFPIFMFCMAVSCAGIQVAVSKMVAAYHGTGKKKAIRQTIKSAGIMSLIVALLSSGCVIAFSEPISRWILKDISCREYLVIMAIAIPFAAVHTCVGGYFYGIRHTAVPAVTQLLEQVVRVVTIYLLGAMMYQKGKMDASVAVTNGLYFEYIEPSEELKQQGQSATGRLWDMLFILHLKILNCPKANMIIYSVAFAKENEKTEFVNLKAVIDVGDDGNPVLTMDIV